MVLLLRLRTGWAPAPSLSASSWRASSHAACLPIRAELIVLSPLHRITQNFVRLVDFFEFPFRRFFVFSDVWMIKTREFSKRFLDLVVGRISRHAKDRIVVFELNCHFAWCSSLVENDTRSTNCERGSF
jgi:hypothetical protein